MVQLTLITDHLECYQTWPYKVVFGRQPETLFDMLAKQGDDKWVVDQLDLETIRAQVDDIVQT